MTAEEVRHGGGDGGDGDDILHNIMCCWLGFPASVLFSFVVLIGSWLSPTIIQRLPNVPHQSSTCLTQAETILNIDREISLVIRPRTLLYRRSNF